jgi:putative membrane-bound dehydrogenase-like protein
LNNDFKIELFASEPQVIDPVELVFDENGRAYVAEMRDYPEDPPPGKPARSRIRILEDHDGDGIIDRSTVFADEVLEVSGLLPWKGGLIVTSAPDILFLKDTNGDGRADLRQVLYTGFPKVNPEARVTNPRLGIDNWIYVSNDGREGHITSPSHPERSAIDVGGTDFRFRLDGDLAEPASGPTQFGATFDDWGNRFITQNTVHTRHVVVPMQYLARAPLLDVPAVAQDISDHGRPSAKIFALTHPQEWKLQRTQLRQQRYHENHLESVRELDPSTEMAGGYFTAAAGGTIYSGDVFPEKYHGNLFTGDVSANLVHRDILRLDGVTFAASRAPEEQDKEFLASTDVWFRPCNFANAPDGNLYVVDIYRIFIETPESIPDSIKKNMNFWSGDTLGRIYRIVANHPLHERSLKPKLGVASMPQLVQELESTNGWHRQTAQRLLVERQDRTVVPLLKRLAVGSTLPQARIHALWTLEGLHCLDTDIVIGALKDPHPRVREQALRLAETFIPQTQQVVDAILAMESDTDTRVEYQLAFTLGKLSGKPALNVLARIASQHARDSWFSIAILSSIHDSASQFFSRSIDKPNVLDDIHFVSQLSALIGAHRDPVEISQFLSSLFRLKQPEAALSGLAKGLRIGGARNLRVPGAEITLQRCLGSSSESMQAAAWETARYLQVPILLRRATADALNTGLNAKQRGNAIGLLRSGSYSSVSPVLLQILSAHPAVELQISAIDSLSAFEEASVAPALVSIFKSLSPETRKKAIDALLKRQERVPVLVKAVEEEEIDQNALDTNARARLLENSDPTIAQRANRLFKSVSDDRSRIVDSFRDVLQIRGDRAKGKMIFAEQCAKCHVPRRTGGRIGPDLSGISNKTTEELLTSILNPSSAIEPRFVNYLVKMRDGTLHDGLIVSETPGAITLRGGAEEGDESLLRRDIVQIRASNVSLMPNDLEKSLTHQGLADVISYLRAGL